MTVAVGRMPVASGWHWRQVMQAPHRLAFLLAMVVLGASGAWWALVQLQRVGIAGNFPYAVAPSLVHASVMTFGFIPLFFAGFLFTAGPRWLDVEPPTAAAVAPALVAQAAGWLLWIVGSHVDERLALAGIALALGGLVRVTWRFWRLIAASRVPDQLHARAIGSAFVLGCLCLAGVVAAAALEANEVGRALVVTGLWGFVVVVYLSVAHRMIPFFTSSALPTTHVWRPGWVLALMLGAALFEALAVWVEFAFGQPAAWLALRALAECGAGALLLWLALRWGLVQSLKIRLLAMLHLGFLWLGIALVLGGVTHALGALDGELPLPLAPLHALTMGCLGSLMLAMVTRVTCGHSGRALVADNGVWALFWLLQAAVLVRVAATVQLAAMQPLLAVAAVLWATVMVAWGIRYGNWYGRARADGRPG